MPRSPLRALLPSAFAAISVAGVAALAHAQGSTNVLPPGPPTNGVPVTPPTTTPVATPTAPNVSVSASPTATAATTAASPAATIPGAPASSKTTPATATKDTEATSAKADKPSAVYDLQACLQLADGHNAQTKMALDRVAQANAQLDEIKYVPWSQWTLSGGYAEVPEIRGTAVYSPNADISVSSSLGPAWKMTIEGVVPIWTFGKIEAANAAAEALLKVTEADVDRVRALVHHDVRRAYFGLMLAHDGRYLLKLALDKIDGAIKHSDENEDADEADVLRMKTYRAEIMARFGEVEKGERIALAALRFLTGVESPAPFDVPDEPIKPPSKPLLDDLVYLASAKVHRAELKMVKAGIEARSAQVDLAKARMYPDIGLGLSFGYANAPIIADQTNPFVVDNANYLRYGIGIVFKWNLDFLPASARVKAAEAQLDEMRDQQAYALGGVGVEVETAYASCKDAETRTKAYGEAEQMAKRWLAVVSAAISIGTKDDKDLVDPLRYFLTDRYNYLQAVMDYDVAVSSLSLATGDDTVAEY